LGCGYRVRIPASEAGERRKKKVEEKVEIKKIVIALREKEIGLSLGEAQELLDILKKTFPKNQKPYVSSPYIIEKSQYPPYPYWDISWDDETSTMCCRKE
jgi:hypothetical protein